MHDANIVMNESKHVVCIAGKRNVDKLSKAEKPQRTRTMKWTIDDAFFAHDKQLEVLRRLIADDTTLEERNFFKKEIKAKLDGYARQDKENGIHDTAVLNSYWTIKCRRTIYRMV